MNRIEPTAIQLTDINSNADGAECVVGVSSIGDRVWKKDCRVIKDQY
ncbi:hypothetical protein [Nostoc sp. NZL]|nr:hypothetical protein [Nostoc sp. NZL]